jgi:endonuclease/exonuclease/phosphatase (EEP) superfamily protein YafD
MFPSVRSGLTRRISIALAGAAMLLCAATVFVQVARPRAGIGVLVAILTPHLLLVALTLALLAIVLVRARSTMLVGLAIAVGALAVLGDEWISLPTGDGQRSITVMTWNMEFGSGAVDQLSAKLSTTDADIVALQELTPQAASAIEANAALVSAFPYRELRPGYTVDGLGLLSRYPLRAGIEGVDPPILAATVTVDTDTRLQLLNVHPLPGRITTVSPLRLPVAFDPSVRDEAVAKVSAVADDLISAGDPVVLAGDLNVASTEPVYDDLVAGLRDAHTEAGTGPGWTWRPSRLELLGAGLLRIDYVLVTPDVHVVSSRQDCSIPGDHCILTVGLRLP